MLRCLCCGEQRGVLCVKLSGEDLWRYSNKIESVLLACRTSWRKNNWHRCDMIWTDYVTITLCIDVSWLVYCASTRSLPKDRQTRTTTALLLSFSSAVYTVSHKTDPLAHMFFSYKRIAMNFAIDGTESPGQGSPGQRFWSGRVGSRVIVSDPTFDPVLCFSMRVYRGVVSTVWHHIGKLISA